MGYFSNGTEGQIYEEHYCNKCVNNADGACPVWGIHLLYNYQQQDNKAIKGILDQFISRSKDGLGNDKCNMFVEVKK
jgi:hypothetical protein